MFKVLILIYIFFFWNFLFSRTGYRFVATLNLLIQIVVFSTIRFTVQNTTAYLFLILLNGIYIGGMIVRVPTFLHIVFGQNVGSNTYGMFWKVFGLANLLQYGYVSGVTPKIGFDGIIYIWLGMSVVSLLIITFGNFQGPWKNPTDELGYCISCIKEK